MSESIIHRWPGTEQVAQAPKRERSLCAGPSSEPQALGQLWPLHNRPRGPTPLHNPPCDLGQLACGPQALPCEVGANPGPQELSFSSSCSFLRASRPPATAYESLKRSLQADHLCLLNHHLSLHLQSPRCSPQGPATAPRGPRPQGPKAGEAEAWDEPVGLLGLPGALVDVRDPRLKGALHLLLAQQLQAQGRVGSARLRGPPTPAGTPPSPPVSSDSEGPQGEAAGAALSGGGHTQPTGPGSPRGQEDRATRDYVPDKPLDLSERGRGRHAPKPRGRPGSLSPPSAHTPSLAPPQGVELPARSGPRGLSNGTKEARAPEPEGPSAPAVRGPPLLLASTCPQPGPAPRRGPGCASLCTIRPVPGRKPDSH